MEDLEGCSLLHLACETADIGMLKLLQQYGANVNASDSRDQTTQSLYSWRESHICQASSYKVIGGLGYAFFPDFQNYSNWKICTLTLAFVLVTMLFYQGFLVFTGPFARSVGKNVVHNT